MVIRCKKCKKSDELVYFADGSILCERCDETMYDPKPKTKKKRKWEREKEGFRLDMTTKIDLGGQI